MRGLELRGRTESNEQVPQFCLPELDLAAGEAAALWGPSGCGKTSVLLGLLGLPLHLDRSAGTVDVLGAPWPTTSHGRRPLLAGPVTVLLQDPKSALDPLHSVADQILASAKASMDRVAGKAAVYGQLVSVLGHLGIRDPELLGHRIPSRISGGEAQRAMLAVAILRRPRLLVVDEPTAHLDRDSRQFVFDALAWLRAECGTAVLVATHDDALIEALDAGVWKASEGVFRPVGARQLTPWPRCPRPSQSDDRPVVLKAEGLASPPLFHDVDVTLHRGDIVTLTGPSGIGKTTLARQLVGLDRARVGTVHRPAGQRSVQLLWQDARSSMTPGLSVRTLVNEIRTPQFDLLAHAKLLGLDAALLDRDVARLSVGETRRAALLRALSVNPAVLICDEPTSSLDRATAARVLDLLFTVQREVGVALWLITHDQDLVHHLDVPSFTFVDGRFRLADRPTSVSALGPS